MSDATTILLIDGNHQDREHYAQRLQLSSPAYDVVQAETGQSGLDHHARQPVDCVILDINLPDMSGFEVLARLVPRVYHPEIAVIVLTGMPNFYMSELVVKNGAQAFLQKPMACGDILDTAILKAISNVRKVKAQQGIHLANVQ